MVREWNDEDFESTAKTLEEASQAIWDQAKTLINRLNRTSSLREIGEKIGCTGNRLSTVRNGAKPPGIKLIKKLLKVANAQA